ncbi:ABC transporter substrate-binding protein [Antarcticibacterium sp. 1MA-6-2]|uniref:ABC transporter substrate-binding protein n=1 Tax=Antarcticibacterium sp. 1MA-6-2 TaxID=2908210 RepID=UPI001F37ED8E|nr:ABC transporter substrate-binding protein [Antarcticibacterium sp. 1MA-6-2]UJH91972.1 ABC transporter substrate-binding protein [Antarcticibacterium sp. 1MA-6-2]
MKNNLLLIFAVLFLSCKGESEKGSSPKPTEAELVEIKYAEGFSIESYEGYKVLIVKDPWPDANQIYRYLLVEDEAKVPADLKFEHKIKIPVENIVVTSTTHIPSLEVLESEEKLIGFPGLDYVSSQKTRNRIESGEITELGKNEAINTEILIASNPDLVIGFAVNGNNKTYNTLKRAGILVIFNGDWTENSPLGKAEWIKFFGALFNKSKEAEEYFIRVEINYQAAKTLAKAAEEKPVVLSGSMYKEQWYVPYGNSWLAQFIEDSNASYIYKDTEGSGSIALAFETVLSDAQNADYWVAPGQFISFEQLQEASHHYEQFKAVTSKNVFTYANTKGETGGVIFYEQAPNRPDLVLKDLISIFHPSLLPDYERTFFKPLD